MEEVNLITQRSNQNPTTKYNVVEEDPASFFDGENKTISLFDEENMSNINGKKRQSRFEKVMSYTPFGLVKQGMENRAKRAPMIDAAKLEKAKSSTAMAKAQEAQVAGDVALAKALEKSTPKGEKSAKSKTMLYVGIGLGILVVGGIITYFIVKGKGKKGK